MSEPLPVAQSFLMDSFSGRVHLDSIVCVIDAENFDQELVVKVPTAIEQLEFADIIILNKYDLANQTKKTQLEDIIRSINPIAPIFNTKFGAVDVRTILDTHAFTLTEEKEHEMNHHHHNHDNGISEYTFHADTSFDTEKLEIFIRSLPKEIYRIKGFINLAGLDVTYLLQRAGRRLTIKEYPEKKKTKLVFIGKDLKNYNFSEALSLCLLV
jgi:G3E family GTPase